MLEELSRRVKMNIQLHLTTDLEHTNQANVKMSQKCFIILECHPKSEQSSLENEAF